MPQEEAWLSGVPPNLGTPSCQGTSRGEPASADEPQNSWGYRAFHHLFVFEADMGNPADFGSFYLFY